MKGNNDAGFVDGQTASPLRRVTGGLVSGFQGINFCGFETFLAAVRARLARLTPDVAFAHPGYEFECETAHSQATVPRSRRVFRASFAINVRHLNSEGAGNAGRPMRPQPRV